MLTYERTPAKHLSKTTVSSGHVRQEDNTDSSQKVRGEAAAKRATVNTTTSTYTGSHQPPCVPAVVREGTAVDLPLPSSRHCRAHSREHPRV